MSRALAALFIDHPRTVGESYFEHMRFAGWFASRLLAAGCAAAIHALVPALFESTASRMVKEMAARLECRH